MGEFLLLLESPQQVRFNRVYFTTFRDKVWKILIFDWILLLKTGFGRKNQLSPQCVHIYIYIYIYICLYLLEMCSHLGQRHRLH
jgi:hypothetical protein